VSPPTAEQQLKFLTNLQRLLSEGQFVATYKYALLLALADIAIETGDDSGEPLTVSTKLIAEKFIQYYWRQVIPYVPKIDPTDGQVLRQNTGKQAAIIRQVVEARQRYGDSLVTAQRDKSAWKALVRRVDQVVRQMPLWKLQTVGRSSFDFLYENHGKGTSIELRPGVAFCLRQFYGLIGDLVRGAWVRYVRRHNHDALGTTADLSEFLFGSERSDLGVVRGILEDVQSGRCFYCEKAMRKAGHVDHFVPWSKYPVDLGHNFVVAHQTCNSAKADHLAAADYLAAWSERNQQHRDQLAAEFSQRGVLHDLPTSVRIANWAYQTTFDAGGLTWARKDDMVALSADWQLPLTQILESSN
jgi:hypothetical protein